MSCSIVPTATIPTSGCVFDPSFVLGPTPPATFFNINGIYSQRFAYPMVETFDRLHSYIIARDQAIDISANPPDPFNNRNENRFVKLMNYQQQLQYQQIIGIFQRVYAYNYQAYYHAAATGTAPIYYRFATSKELSEYKSAVGLINKLYNVNERYPVACIFYLPFPPFCP